MKVYRKLFTTLLQNVVCFHFNGRFASTGNLERGRKLITCCRLAIFSYSYIYTDSTNEVKLEDALATLAAARKYGISGIMTPCVRSIKRETSGDNALTMLLKVQASINLIVPDL